MRGNVWVRERNGATGEQERVGVGGLGLQAGSPHWTLWVVGAWKAECPNASPTLGLQNRVWYWGELFGDLLIWQAELVPASLEAHWAGFSTLTH